MNFVAEGRKHDAGIIAESHLLDDLRQYAFSLAGSREIATKLNTTPSVYTFNVHLEMEF